MSSLHALSSISTIFNQVGEFVNMCVCVCVCHRRSTLTHVQVVHQHRYEFNASILSILPVIIGVLTPLNWSIQKKFAWNLIKSNHTSHCYKRYTHIRWQWVWNISQILHLACAVIPLTHTAAANTRSKGFFFKRNGAHIQGACVCDEMPWWK